VGFWLEVAGQHPGPVLELACGTGRLTLPLAAALTGDGTRPGTIVGLDRDPNMLHLACRRAAALAPPGRPRFVAADMRHFALAARFALVFVGYNSLQLLNGPDEMLACLTEARRHLAAGGVVGVEVTDFQQGAADGGAATTDVLLGAADGIRLYGDLVHDLAGRSSRYRRRFVGDGWTVEDEVVVRSLDRGELQRLLAQAGLTATGWWRTGATVRVVAAP
jgi:ubiquinone/menaquinone biosynthesis C-methylase UbiE